MIYKTKISIIIPVFNHEKFIYQCLESIKKQTFKDWEAIIINDGSTDKSKLIIENFIKNDNRFILINQKNEGIYNLHKTYNKALKISRGDFIAILEGDDFWPIDKLSKQIKSFDNKDIGLSWGDGFYVNEKGKIICSIDFQIEKWGNNVVKNIPVGVSTDYFFFSSNYFNMPTCSVMYKKCVLNEIGGFWQPTNLKWLDKPTWILISLKYKFAYCNYNTGYWRRHKNQVTYKNQDQKSTLEYIINSDISKFLLLQKILSKKKIQIKIYILLISTYRNFISKNYFILIFNIFKLIIYVILYPLNFLKLFYFLIKLKL